jgi:hypothetical protein
MHARVFVAAAIGVGSEMLTPGCNMSVRSLSLSYPDPLLPPNLSISTGGGVASRWPAAWRLGLQGDEWAPIGSKGVHEEDDVGAHSMQSPEQERQVVCVPLG